jgi:hypothetical protein
MNTGNSGIKNHKVMSGEVIKQFGQSIAIATENSLALRGIELVDFEFPLEIFGEGKG